MTRHCRDCGDISVDLAGKLVAGKVHMRVPDVDRISYTLKELGSEDNVYCSLDLSPLSSSLLLPPAHESLTPRFLFESVAFPSSPTAITITKRTLERGHHRTLVYCSSIPPSSPFPIAHHVPDDDRLR
jgi:hypothetical protein